MFNRLTKLLSCLFLLITLFLLNLIFTKNVQAITYYVSTTGNDANNGSLNSPWRTIQRAANVVIAGDIVYVRGGTYNQKFSPVNSGTATNYIIYASYPGETATLDGGGVALNRTGYGEGLIDISGKNYIRLQRMTLRNSSWIGVNIHPATSGVRANHIDVDNLTVLDTYESGIKFNRSDYINATSNNIERVSRSSGIASWFSTNVFIDHNRIQNAHIFNQSQGGHEESLSVASTSNFEVSYNDVSMGTGYTGYLGNEGIDVKEASRFGSVHHNYVHDYRSAGGAIYLDSWQSVSPSLSNVNVYNNYTRNTVNGIVVGSEEGGTTENINVYNNIIYNTGAVGIGIPEHIPTRVPGTPEGWKRNINIYNNTIYQAQANGGAGIYITSTRVRNIVIKNNIVYFSNYNGEITVGSSAILPYVAADHNLVFGPKYCSQAFPNCVELSNNPPGWPLIHSNSTADPRFVSLTIPNLHLQSTSPAINTGVNLAPLATADYDGIPRPQGSAYDIGAYEFTSVIIPSITPPVTPIPTNTPAVQPTIILTSPTPTIPGSIPTPPTAIGDDCTGYFTHNAGTCYFGRCPAGYNWEGISPIFPVCSGFGEVCCTLQPTPIPKPPLDPQARCSGWGNIYTAIGCISVNSPTGLASFILRWSIGVGGGIAFIFIVIGAFLIITSKGDPEKVKAGKEILTSAIGGLLLIIFSIFLLEVIGVRILRLPGF